MAFSLGWFTTCSALHTLGHWELRPQNWKRKPLSMSNPARQGSHSVSAMSSLSKTVWPVVCLLIKGHRKESAVSQFNLVHTTQSSRNFQHELRHKYIPTYNKHSTLGVVCMCRAMHHAKEKLTSCGQLDFYSSLAFSEDPCGSWK